MAYCVFEGSAEQNLASAVSTMPSLTKYAIHFDLEGSTERNMIYTMSSSVFEIVVEHRSFPSCFRLRLRRPSPTK